MGRKLPRGIWVFSTIGTLVGGVVLLSVANGRFGWANVKPFKLAGGVCECLSEWPPTFLRFLHFHRTCEALGVNSFSRQPRRERKELERYDKWKNECYDRSADYYNKNDLLIDNHDESYRDYIAGGDLKLSPKVKATRKVVVITGANTGIGKETARALAKREAAVYMACRNMVECEKARQEIVEDTRNPNVYCRKCDLADFDSIRQFATEFKAEEGKLDILINNAGVMRCPRMLTRQGIEMQLGVNHMGHFLLTNLLLDHLKAAAPSRIVVVSSLAHTRGQINFDDLNSEKSYDSSKAYEQSKLANVLFTKELARRLEGTGVTVNALHPGMVYTELGRHMSISKSFLASIFVRPLLKFLLKTPVQGSHTSVYVALAPSLDNVSGKYFSDCQEQEVAPQAADMTVAAKLWATSEKWTRLNA